MKPFEKWNGWIHPAVYSMGYWVRKRFRNGVISEEIVSKDKMGIYFWIHVICMTISMWTFWYSILKLKFHLNFEWCTIYWCYVIPQIFTQNENTKRESEMAYSSPHMIYTKQTNIFSVYCYDMNVWKIIKWGSLSWKS